MRDQTMGVPNRATWREKSLQDICTMISRGTAPTYVETSSVFAIGQRCVQHSGFDASAARPHDKRFRHVLWACEGDVLLNSTGTGTIGRSCVFPGSGKFMVDSHVTVLRSDRTQADPRWIAALLRSQWGQKHLESHCYTGSTNQIELSRKELMRTTIPAPPIEEQQRIADVLDTLESSISHQKALIRKLGVVLTGIKRALLAHASEGIDSSVGRIFDIKAGITLGPDRTSRKDGAPYLRVANVQREHIDLTDVALIHASATERIQLALQTDDLLVVEGHANPNEIGRCARVQREASGMLYQNHLFRLRSEQVNPEFAELWLNSEHARSYWRKLCATSSGLYTINSKMLAAMPFPTLPQSEQLRISNGPRDIRQRIAVEEAELNKLESLKKGVMEDLLTGRVRVLDAENTLERL